jgi:hypothetical protein
LGAILEIVEIVNYINEFVYAHCLARQDEFMNQRESQESCVWRVEMQLRRHDRDHRLFFFLCVAMPLPENNSTEIHASSRRILEISIIEISSALAQGTFWDESHEYFRLTNLTLPCQLKTTMIGLGTPSPSHVVRLM